MKTVFDLTTREELLRRINAIHENSPAQWGKMNSYQMIRHCGLWEQMIVGKLPVKRAFIGRIFGRIALRAVMKNDHPLGKNSPTVPALVIKETTGDLRQLKQEWIHSIEAYSHFNTPVIIHPFFGAITRDQVGMMAYKHADHHLRQFGM